MSTKHKLVGLDTSFVLRLLTGHPELQAKQALDQLDALRHRGQKAAISDLVVSETYFALQYHYEVPKAAALQTIKELLQSPEIHPLGHALPLLQQHKNLAKTNPGFVDRLIHTEYLHHADSMLSFEKAAVRLPGCQIAG